MRRTILALALAACGGKSSSIDAPGCPTAACGSEQFCVIDIRGGNPGDPPAGCNALPASCAGSSATCACVQAAAGSDCGCVDTADGPRLTCGHG